MTGKLPALGAQERKRSVARLLWMEAPRQLNHLHAFVAVPYDDAAFVEWGVHVECGRLHGRGHNRNIDQGGVGEGNVQRLSPSRGRWDDRRRLHPTSKSRSASPKARQTSSRATTSRSPTPRRSCARSRTIASGRTRPAPLELARKKRSTSLQAPVGRARILSRALSHHRRWLLRVHRPRRPEEKTQGQMAVHETRRAVVLHRRYLEERRRG